LQAHDGKEALEVLETENKNICLMFLDWQLPKVDGLEVLKRVARNPLTASLPVIMLTSTTSPESEEIAQLLNPNLKNFLVKPLEPQEIVQAALPLIK
jgi:two-component system chemotaxis response regulator CheY